MNKTKLVLMSSIVFVALLTLSSCTSAKKATSPSSSAKAADVDTNAGTNMVESADDNKSGEGVVDPSLKDEPMPEQQKKTSQTYLPLAKAIRGGNQQVILDEASKILASKPNDMIALNTLALYHYRKGHLGAARLLINRAFEKNDPSAALLNNLGVICLDEGDQGAAIVNFKKAISIESTNFAALGNLGSIYARGGDYDRAAPLLEKAHAQNPKNMSVANNYAITLRMQGKLPEAQKIYEDLIQKNRDDLAANLNLAILLVDYMNKPKDGLVVLNRIKFLDTERKDIRTRLNALEKKARAEVQ
jgi:Tfp pilus assembly protein PilF